MSLSIELVASIPNKKTFDGVDAGIFADIFDGFYLGQPYCLKSQGNFLVDHDDLRVAVGALRERGKKAYLTTPAIPKGKDLAMVRKAIAVAVAAGIDGVEAHDVGVFRILRNEFPTVAAHVGNFANVYNEKTAALYKRLGAARIVPSHELTGEELAIVAAVEGVEFARPVHGPLPLGMAYACLLRRTGDGETVDPCRQQCATEHFMELDGWRMRSVGTSVLMGEDYCLVEHLAGLLSAGVSTMRLETYFDSPERINALGKIYRRALDDALAGRSAGAEQVEAVRALTTAGLCNGWHFGQSGREYVGAGEALSISSAEKLFRPIKNKDAAQNAGCKADEPGSPQSGLCFVGWQRRGEGACMQVRNRVEAEDNAADGVLGGAPDNGHKKIELMSPAGSLEGAKLAVDAGADVVYAGVKNLSMRPKRVEFDQNLGELIDYTHGRGKKVYVTTNVCPKPSDIPLFEKRMAEVSALGADAVIVSDPWVMEHVRDNYPNLPIHASIMTSVVNAEAAKFYKERGATMVVISRSLGDLDEIRRIKEEVKVDLEVFVHGGICYMYDGDCYMSSYWRQRRDFDPDLGVFRLFGQNNTKGECQLICKRDCALTSDGEVLAKGRLMRRADDVGLDRLPFYIGVGVRTLKIEGRAMSLNYIAEATRLYRQAIDLYYADPERWQVRDEWRPAVDELIEARLEYERTWHIG